MSFLAAAFDLSDAHLAHLPCPIIGHASSAFAKNHRGKFGFGERFRTTTTGAQRFATARDRWAELTARPPAQLPAGLTSSAPVSFAAFTFDPRSAVESLLVVPKFVLEVTETATRLHYIYEAATTPPAPDTIFTRFLAELPQESATVGQGAFSPVDAQMSQRQFHTAVETALKMLETTELEKIVLARDELLRSPTGFHIPETMRCLAQQNPTAWTYKVDRLIGSTPELLIARQDDAARARVLAGTVDRTVAVTDQLIAEQLADNPKQIFEHQAAVDSLVEKLAPFATTMDVSKAPFILQLPNVYHLATDVTAELTASTSILDLVAAINPTAAVGGTPRQAALDAIWQLEAQQHGMDRGLYAGAVGWLDADGHGEFGIALRGSVIEDAHHVRVYAGGGIVAGSDPDEELAETHAKLRPMKRALASRAQEQP